MRILIYGAGVIGCLYAVLLSNAGFDITIYARGNRLKYIKEHGLKYKHKKSIAKAKVHIIDHLEDTDRYQFIFLTVREQQLKEALTELKCNCSDTIVTMVNTIEPYTELEKICGEGRILPAFPGAGGSIDNGVLDADLTPWIIQPTTFGEIRGKQSKRIRTLTATFRKSHIPYQVVTNMHYWQISHLGMVVPLADAYYVSDTPQYVYLNHKLMQDTAKKMKRNFRYLAKRNMLSPRKFYLFLICPDILLITVLKLTYKSSFGNRFMYQHSMNAPEEMRQLHKDFYSYIRKNYFEYFFGIQPDTDHSFF